MPSLRLVYYYILHFLKSFRLHGIHSPYVFKFHNQVIKHSGNFSAFASIEKVRTHLLTSTKSITVSDLGAGSRINNQQRKRISQIARTSANPPKIGQFLFRLVNFQQPRTILEIGTSFGLTTAYLASSRKKAEVITLEGCPETARQAGKNFKNLKLNNIKQVLGNFDDTLPAELEKLKQLDFVLFDGNHQYEPTIRYFEWCLTKKTNDSIFVFDDIYWSEGMYKAWSFIARHPDVTLSIDLFYLGILFFRQNQPKQHFTIRL